MDISARQNWLSAGRGAAVLAITLLALAPAARAQDARSLGDRIERLERDIGTLQRQIYRGQAGNGVPMDGAAALADQSQIDQMQDQQRQITGALEEVQNSVSQLRSRLDRLSGDVDQRLSALEHGGTADPATLSQPPTAGADPLSLGGPRSPTATLNRGAIATPPRPSAPPTPLSPGYNVSPGNSLAPGAPIPLTRSSTDNGTSLPSGSAQEQYNYAFGLLRQSQYAEAEQALRSFVQRNPSDPLAGNAQYWIGESFFNRGDYPSAAQAFAEAYQRYPNSNKAPDVLLGLGMSLGKLGQKADACRTYARLDREFQTAPGAVKDRARNERQKLSCA